MGSRKLLVPVQPGDPAPWASRPARGRPSTLPNPTCSLGSPGQVSRWGPGSHSSGHWAPCRHSRGCQGCEAGKPQAPSGARARGSSGCCTPNPMCPGPGSGPSASLVPPHLPAPRGVLWPPDICILFGTPQTNVTPLKADCLPFRMPCPSSQADKGRSDPWARPVVVAGVRQTHGGAGRGRGACVCDWWWPSACQCSFASRSPCRPGEEV